MKKETKELVRTLGIALVVMMVVPLVYRVCIYFWPPEEKPHPTLAEFLKEAESANCIQLLKKPISKWSDEEAKLEPEIYLWLKDQGNNILPWEWTEEARRMGMGHKGQERQEGAAAFRLRQGYGGQAG